MFITQIEKFVGESEGKRGVRKVYFYFIFSEQNTFLSMRKSNRNYHKQSRQKILMPVVTHKVRLEWGKKSYFSVANVISLMCVLSTAERNTRCT